MISTKFGILWIRAIKRVIVRILQLNPVDYKRCKCICIGRVFNLRMWLIRHQDVQKYIIALNLRGNLRIEMLLIIVLVKRSKVGIKV
jgi:hypothetical protein